MQRSAGSMARKLKTFTTSAGFFDLAVAAPSMKAALEAWGSKNNLFQHGFAKVSEDPKIVAATMAHPGVVLRRPVGSNGAFSEHAELPTDLPVGKAKHAPAKRSAKRPEPPTKPVDDKTAREAARAFEKEQKRRDSERRREEANRQRERERRERAVAAVEAALEQARQDHEARVEDIEKDRAALDKRSQAEDGRWRKKKEELEAELRKARSGSHLRLV
jgi:colicin import membrane protein